MKYSTLKSVILWNGEDKSRRTETFKLVAVEPEKYRDCLR
jgi:hypothetical protein